MKLEALDRLIVEVIAPNAEAVDRNGEFPKQNIDALRELGIFGLTTSPVMGGGGGGLPEAAAVIERLAGACGSTAMIVLMHYAANAVIEAHGAEPTRRAIAADNHLTTLAFSEAGSRSHFWAPGGTATPDGDHVRLDAQKSWVTSAAAAASFVWSSRAMAAPGPMTLWLVPSSTAGLSTGVRRHGSTGQWLRPGSGDGRSRWQRRPVRRRWLRP